MRLKAEEPSLFLPAMVGDREKTARIIVSLLSNAYKFAPGGEVRALVDVSGGRVRYRVSEARGLARFLGGDVELVTGEGNGAEFVVDLPLAGRAAHSGQETTGS